jgi:hypothetical protein
MSIYKNILATCMGVKPVFSARQADVISDIPTSQFYALSMQLCGKPKVKLFHHLNHLSKI